ncbi:MAG: Type I restriction-modification system specificity determinant [bacterium P3]|nr:MAG: Type I restriction-modification system specificity determinant [bacterium P3]KWW42624.1 MAG: Type I restriction-modification system specificity determinant [bacterium F083]
MTNNQIAYKRLGDYIREVNVRNRELKVTEPMGINIDKHFMPSVANVIGTDLSTYKLVSKNQFACNLMHVGRDEKIPMAMQTDDNPIIVSPAYFVFEVTKTDELLPEYLMMWFCRKEFDRNAWFYTDADVRGGLDKEALMDMQLPVPSIERQREIVSEYETLTRRIRLNNQMIEKLEATAQALYRKTFVANIDKQNLPDGWRMGTIGEFCKEIKSGGTPNRNCYEYWNKKDYPWLKTGEVQNNIIFDTEEYISQTGLNNSSAKLIPKGAVIMAMYGATAAQVAYLECDTTTNQACCNMICRSKKDSAFLFFHLLSNQEDIKKLANGGAQENLSQELIAQQPIILFNNDEKKQMFVPILDNLIVKYKENIKLTELQSLFLAKMGQ